MTTTTLTIEGMNCDGCARRLQSRLSKEPGVREASVSYADSTARLIFNPTAVNEDRLVEVVELAGFSVPVELANRP